MQRSLMGAAVAFSLLALSAANTQPAKEPAALHFTARLTGSSELPPNPTRGTGRLAAALDVKTKALSYQVSYSDLTGPPVAAHFHGPATPGKDAPPVVPVTDLANPMNGAATLTDSQIADLRAGKWYFNIHTAAHPGGEIRGQVQPSR